MYEVEMSDSTTEAYTANINADNIYAQCDDEGNMYTLMDKIIDHKKRLPCTCRKGRLDPYTKWNQKTKVYHRRVAIACAVQGQYCWN